MTKSVLLYDFTIAVSTLFPKKNNKFHKITNNTLDEIAYVLIQISVRYLNILEGNSPLRNVTPNPNTCF